MTAWLVISAVIAGAIVSMQPAINAEFGRRGGGPLAAALTSFLGGVLVILIVSTLFTLIVVPLLFSLVLDGKRAAYTWLRWEMPELEQPPAPTDAA